MENIFNQMIGLRLVFETLEYLNLGFLTIDLEL